MRSLTCKDIKYMDGALILYFTKLTLRIQKNWKAL